MLPVLIGYSRNSNLSKQLGLEQMMGGHEDKSLIIVLIMNEDGTSNN